MLGQPSDRHHLHWFKSLPTWRHFYKHMFYHNTKYRFALPPGSPETIAGAIVLACAMPEGQLLRRDMRKQPFLQHRMFDPQLYLATLDANTASKSVCNLATWPWFGERGVPQYDS